MPKISDLQITSVVPDAELPVDTSEVETIQDTMDRLTIDTGSTKKSVPSSFTAAKLHPQPDDNTLEKFDYDSIAVNMVQFQAEYHFSDANLAMDNYLLSQLHECKDYWLPVTIIAGLSGIKQITEDIEIVKKALKQSELLELSEDGSKVRRPNLIPPKPKQHKDIRRTAFLYGLPPDFNAKQILQLTAPYGIVKSIAFESGIIKVYSDKCCVKDIEKPDAPVALSIMTKKMGPKAIRSNSASFQDMLSPSEQNEFLRASQQQRFSNHSNSSCDSLSAAHSLSFAAHANYDFQACAPKTPVFVHPLPNPNGNPLDFSHLKTCFVVFESQSQTNNFIRSRARSSDGIRACNQYEYIKYQKKLAVAEARGISALISPNSIALALNSPSYAIMGSHRKHSSSSPQQSQQWSVDRHRVEPVLLPQTQTPSLSNQSAMDYYLNNMTFTDTPEFAEKIADAVRQIFRVEAANNMNAGGADMPKYSEPRRPKSAHGTRSQQSRNAWNNYRSSNNNNKTWSNAQHRQRGHGQLRHSDNGYFNFEAKPMENDYRRYSDNRRYQSKTTSHRDMNRSWRRNNNKGDGRFPPSPSPNYGVGVVSNNAPKYVMTHARKNPNQRRHVSPSFTPKQSRFVAPRY